MIEKLGIKEDWKVANPNGIKMILIPETAECGSGNKYFAFGGTADESIRDSYLQLVSAAPEMLESLMMLRNAWENQNNCEAMNGFVMAENAIEKATGKSFDELKHLIEY